MSVGPQRTSLRLRHRRSHRASPSSRRCHPRCRWSRCAPMSGRRRRRRPVGRSRRRRTRCAPGSGRLRPGPACRRRRRSRCAPTTDRRRRGPACRRRRRSRLRANVGPPPPRSGVAAAPPTLPVALRAKVGPPVGPAAAPVAVPPRVAPVALRASAGPPPAAAAAGLPVALRARVGPPLLASGPLSRGLRARVAAAAAPVAGLDVVARGWVAGRRSAAARRRRRRARRRPSGETIHAAVESRAAPRRLGQRAPRAVRERAPGRAGVPRGAPQAAPAARRRPSSPP